MEVPFRLLNTSGVAITNLVKADVVFKNESLDIKDYTGFINLGYGNYVCYGLDFAPVQCRMYINTVVQGWFGLQELGNPELKYALASTVAILENEIDGKVSKTDDETIAGNKTFSIPPITAADPSADNHTTRKSWVVTQLVNLENSIATAISNILTAISNILTGISHFTGKIFLNEGIDVSGTGSNYNFFRNKTNFVNEAPYSPHPPTTGTQLTNVNYVQSEIDTRINAFSPTSYQESPNVIRLIPNGTEVMAQVYTTYAAALAYAKHFADSINKQVTILISGEGTSGEVIGMATIDGKLNADFVHLKGLGADIRLDLLNGNISEHEFEATTLWNTVVENIHFSADDGDTGNTGEIKNIVFKDCIFETKTSIVLTFINCHFEGLNHFKSTSENQFNFINCTGVPIQSDNNVVVSGTNQILYYTKNKLQIGEANLAFATDKITLDKSLTVDGNFSSLNINTNSCKLNSNSRITPVSGDEENVTMYTKNGRYIIICQGSIYTAEPYLYFDYAAPELGWQISGSEPD